MTVVVFRNEKQKQRWHHFALIKHLLPTQINPLLLSVSVQDLERLARKVLDQRLENICVRTSMLLSYFSSSCWIENIKVSYLQSCCGAGCHFKSKIKQCCQILREKQATRVYENKQPVSIWERPPWHIMPYLDLATVKLKQISTV